MYSRKINKKFSLHIYNPFWDVNQYIYASQWDCSVYGSSKLAHTFMQRLDNMDLLIYPCSSFIKVCMVEFVNLQNVAYRNWILQKLAYRTGKTLQSCSETIHPYTLWYPSNFVQRRYTMISLTEPRPRATGVPGPGPLLGDRLRLPPVSYTYLLQEGPCH